MWIRFSFCGIEITLGCGSTFLKLLVKSIIEITAGWRNYAWRRVAEKLDKKIKTKKELWRQQYTQWIRYDTWMSQQIENGSINEYLDSDEYGDLIESCESRTGVLNPNNNQDYKRKRI